ncbi:hypothetical protein D3870_03220 [Noviherbaspirillum cavernae]|uniref:WYL domain-containing protein n=1 Tax=Noviherbaspirillum cavernae TaxID=2320862 RepID=A0A418WY47_9BURK|nr:hypothetical protein [Noviherbaspirillum cavernae]RJG05158.1 hypothetical protein D3870_03220 [Noviherbaspirillum cavernae]
MNATICKAIEEKRVLELRYHGYSRIVEPHIHGEDKNGDEVVRCYQLAGGSESGERAGWKLLKIKDAVLVHLTETPFVPRPEYKRDDKVVIDVFCRI